MIECRPSSVFSLPYIRIKNIFHSVFPLIGQSSSGINIVRCELRIYLCLPVHAVGNNHRHMFTSDITDSFCLAAFGRQIIEFRRFQSRDIRMVLPQQNIIHQFAGHRDFSFRSFTQRYPNGISQSVTQQCTDAKGGLDTPILSVSGFCHSEV